MTAKDPEPAAQTMRFELLESLLNSPGDSGIDEKWLPLLSYVRKLTESPSRVTDLDARLVFDAGFKV